MRNRDHHKKPPGGFPQKSSNPICGCLESTTKSQPFDGEMTSMFNPQNEKQHPLGEITSKNVTNASKKKLPPNYFFFATCFFSPEDLVDRGCDPALDPGEVFFKKVASWICFQFDD